MFRALLLTPLLLSGFSLGLREADLKKTLLSAGDNDAQYKFAESINRIADEAEESGVVVFERVSLETIDRICRNLDLTIYIRQEDITINCQSFREVKTLVRREASEKDNIEEGSGDEDAPEVPEDVKEEEKPVPVQQDESANSETMPTQDKSTNDETEFKNQEVPEVDQSEDQEEKSDTTVAPQEADDENQVQNVAGTESKDAKAEEKSDIIETTPEVKDEDETGTQDGNGESKNENETPEEKVKDEDATETQDGNGESKNEDKTPEEKVKDEDGTETQDGNGESKNEDETPEEKVKDEDGTETQDENGESKNEDEKVKDENGTETQDGNGESKNEDETPEENVKDEDGTETQEPKNQNEKSETTLVPTQETKSQDTVTEEAAKIEDEKSNNSDEQTQIKNVDTTEVRNEEENQQMQSKEDEIKEEETPENEKSNYDIRMDSDEMTHNPVQSGFSEKDAEAKHENGKSILQMDKVAAPEDVQTGESSKDTKAASASKDTTILVVLFVAVLIVGAAAFGYNFIKKRKQQSTDLERGEKTSSLKRSLQNLTTKTEPSPQEMKPLIQGENEVEMLEIQKQNGAPENSKTEKIEPVKATNETL